MKRFLLAAAIAATTLSLQAQASDIGVSVNIGQPGFYGRLDIGGFPAPALLFPPPLMIERGPVGRPPLYLRVPPGHARNWRRHCHEYRACGEQVYFVRDDWYDREYVPRYQERHGDHRGYERDYRRDDYRRDERREDRHEHRDNDRYDGRGDGDRDRGHGNGRGRD
jgi:hypothetical protein